MADIFHEVDESLRQDRLQAMFRRYAPYGLGALIIIIAVVGGREYMVADAQAKAAAGADAYSEATALLERGEVEAARTRFAQLAEEGSDGYRTAAKMREAAMLLEMGGGAEAAAKFEEAAEFAQDRLLRDLALLKAAYASADELSFEALETRVTPLSEPGRPMEYAARELLAAAALNAGELDKAQEGYRFLSLAQDAPNEQRARAEQALALLRAQSWATTEVEEE